MGWSSWSELGGTTRNACTAFAADDKLYLFANGEDDRKVYVRSRGTNWGGWTEFGGTSDAPLAAVEFDGAYHFFGKGIDDRKIYVRTTDSIPGPKRWKELGGTTGTSVSAVVFDGRLYVFATGDADKKIYVCSRAPGGNWNAWKEFGGTTDVAVTTVVFKNELYIFSKGLADSQLYVSSRRAGGNWSAWRQVGGATSVPVAAAVFAGDLHLFAKGLGDDHVYSTIVGRANHWHPWYPLPPVQATTDAAVAVAPFRNTLHLFGKGIGDRKIYSQSMHIYRLPFEDDGQWTWGRGNWDEPKGGHGPGDQSLDFDFDHPEGGNVRAARAGVVVFVENNPHNTSVVPTAPGWGTAVHIRHDDDSTAAYMHMQFNSTRVNEGDRVTRGQIIGLSGNTGDSSHAHLHFGIHSSTNGNAGTGPHVPVYFRDKNHDAWRPMKGDPLASDNS